MNDLKTYNDQVHIYGRIWMLTAFVLMILVPTAIGLRYSSWPSLTVVLKGLLGVAPIFWTVAVIEILTFTPMLGTGGSYLGFVTGNLTNLKVPCALYAMENAGVSQGTMEGELVSTMAIAVSSLVTTLIIALGVFLMVPLTPLLNSEALKPAFDNILPALFGGLMVVYVGRNWKIALVPFVVMIILFISIEALAHAVSLMVPVGAALAIAAARILYRKGFLGGEK